MKLIITVGIPASGKSTWSKEQVLKGNGTVKRANKDDIRATYPHMKEWKVIETEDGLIQDFMDRKIETIICDNTHMNKRHWTRLESLAAKNGYSVEYKWFDDSLDPELCHKRNLATDRKPVPWTVIEKMYMEYFKLYLERENIEIRRSGVPIVICDIDGTVANMEDIRGPFEWHAVDRDTPHRDVIELVRLLMQQYQVVFMSGRDEVCREKTENWLRAYVVGDSDFSLYMRKEGDQRRDSIVKYELFMKHIHTDMPFSTVKYVLDDRHQVCRLWRALGFRCLQVDAGLF